MDAHALFGSVMVTLAIVFIFAMAWVFGRADED